MTWTGPIWISVPLHQVFNSNTFVDDAWPPWSRWKMLFFATSDHPSFAGHLRTPWERLPSLSVRSLPPGNGSIAGIHWWESPWWHLRRVSWSTRSCWMPRSIWQMGQHGTAKIRYGRFETDWEWVEDNWIGWTSTHTTYHWTCQNLQVAGFGGKYSATHSVWLADQPLFGRQLSCHVMSCIYIYINIARPRHPPAAMAQRLVGRRHVPWDRECQHLLLRCCDGQWCPSYGQIELIFNIDGNWLQLMGASEDVKFDGQAMPTPIAQI